MANAAGLLGPEITLKRFTHKRAFLTEGVCCEILLIDPTGNPPLTRFWGDVLFSWRRPLLELEGVAHEAHAIPMLSRANLQHQRAQHRNVEPHRWRSYQPPGA